MMNRITPITFLSSGMLSLMAGLAHGAPSCPDVINPPAWASVSQEWQYSQARRSGNLLFISGQVGIDPRTGQVPTSFDAEASLAFENLREILAEAGLGFSDIIELDSYLTQMDNIDKLRAVKSDYISAPFPAWTVVGVQNLVDPGLHLEIKAVARMRGCPPQ